MSTAWHVVFFRGISARHSVENVVSFLAGDLGYFSGEWLLAQTDEYISSFVSHGMRESERRSKAARERDLGGSGGSGVGVGRSWVL